MKEDHPNRQYGDLECDRSKMAGRRRVDSAVSPSLEVQEEHPPHQESTCNKPESSKSLIVSIDEQGSDKP
jgi:hypothetical protein